MMFVVKMVLNGVLCCSGVFLRVTELSAEILLSLQEQIYQISQSCLTEQSISDLNHV